MRLRAQSNLLVCRKSREGQEDKTHTTDSPRVLVGNGWEVFDEKPDNLDCCSFEALFFIDVVTFTKLFEVDVFEAAVSEGRCLAPATPTSRFMAPNVPTGLEPGGGTWIGSDGEQHSSPVKLFVPDGAVSALFWLPFSRTECEPTNGVPILSDCSCTWSLDCLTSLPWAWAAIFRPLSA